MLCHLLLSSPNPAQPLQECAAGAPAPVPQPMTQPRLSRTAVAVHLQPAPMPQPSHLLQPPAARAQKPVPRSLSQPSHSQSHNIATALAKGSLLVIAEPIQHPQLEFHAERAQAGHAAPQQSDLSPPPSLPLTLKRNAGADPSKRAKARYAHASPGGNIDQAVGDLDPAAFLTQDPTARASTPAVPSKVPSIHGPSLWCDMGNPTFHVRATITPEGDVLMSLQDCVVAALGLSRITPVAEGILKAMKQLWFSLPGQPCFGCVVRAAHTAGNGRKIWMAKAEIVSRIFELHVDRSKDSARGKALMLAGFVDKLKLVIQQV